MRSDMHKVVTEQPRAGHHNKSKKYRQKIDLKGLIIDESDNFPCDDDFGPNFVSSQRHSQYQDGCKEFTDNLGPLIRYLRSQCGRQWNDVYSEIRRTLPRGNAAIDHIMGYVMDEVATDCIIENGKVYDKKKIAHWDNGIVDEGFFVHPVNGTLNYMVKKLKPRPPAKPTKYQIGNNIFLELIDGIWYQIEVYGRHERIIDWVSGLPKDVWREYTTKHQIGSKLLKKYDLHNEK